MSLLEPPSFASWADLEREALACTKCPLAETRTQVVFGVGDPHADLLFVGEGPGEQEDLTGEPFVGRAGRLLTSLIEGIGLTRADLYIANVVKCRPPGNRDPLPLEIETCRPYLEAQIAFSETNPDPEGRAKLRPFYASAAGMWMKAGRYERAIVDFEKALKIKADDEEASQGLAEARQKLAEARLDLEKRE